MYQYNARDEMIAIREPGRTVENWFDESGRLVRQVVNQPDWSEPDIATLAYVTDGSSVIQTDLIEGRVKETYRFNRSHYILSETDDADGRAPITITYQRDGTTNVAQSMTLSCVGPHGPVTRTVSLASKAEDRVKEHLIRQECLAGER